MQGFSLPLTQRVLLTALWFAPALFKPGRHIIQLGHDQPIRGTHNIRTSCPAQHEHESLCNPVLEYNSTGNGFPIGSATQVMLATQFCATVGQKQPRKQGGQQQRWSSEMRAQHVDRTDTRKMVIPAMANSIINV